MTFFKRASTHYGNSPEPETPYQRAAQVWDDRIGSARVQAKNWRLMAFGCLILSAGFAGALVWQSARGTVVPWVVEVDRTGEARSVEPDDASIPAGFIADSSIAEPAVKRKLGAMLDLASSLLDEVTCDLPEAEKIRLYEERMNATLIGIRDAYARVTSSDDASLAGLQQIVDFAIRIERCGDVLAGKLLTLRLDQLRGSYQFTEQGNREITEMVEALRRTIILAHETAWTGDPVPAERLVRHKQHVSDLEERSRHRHLSRLRGGNLISLASSNQHLETIAAPKEINSKMATIGYAVLEQHGGLKKTRLKSSVTGSAT